MAEEANQGSAGEMMILGLIDHADRLGKSAQGTQRALSEQIQELAQLQQWAVNAALEIQKQAGVAIKGLETERGRIQGSQTNLERNAMQAIHDAVEKQSGKIGRQVESALACSFDNLVAQYYRAIWRTLRELPDVADQGLFSKVRLSSS
jgi:predicted AAA+ superfamily ATPase